MPRPGDTGFPDPCRLCDIGIAPETGKNKAHESKDSGP